MGMTGDTSQTMTSPTYDTSIHFGEAGHLGWPQEYQLDIRATTHNPVTTTKGSGAVVYNWVQCEEKGLTLYRQGQGDGYRNSI